MDWYTVIKSVGYKLVTHKQWTKMFQVESTKMLVKILIGSF